MLVEVLMSVEETPQNWSVSQLSAVPFHWADSMLTSIRILYLADRIGSVVVAQPSQGLTCCSFWDYFLLTVVVE